MPRIFFCVFIFTVFYTLHECQPFKGIVMVPERVDVRYINPKYMLNVSITVRRISRGGEYIVNMSGYNKHVWANNVSVSLYAYEFLHNEYRRSFIEVSYKLCDFVNLDTYGKIIQKYGVVCPLYVNHWVIKNASIILPAFPYVFPFTKGKFEVVLNRTTPPMELMARVFIFIKIKEI